LFMLRLPCLTHILPSNTLSMPAGRLLRAHSPPTCRGALPAPALTSSNIPPPPSQRHSAKPALPDMGAKTARWAWWHLPAGGRQWMAGDTAGAHAHTRRRCCMNAALGHRKQHYRCLGGMPAASPPPPPACSSPPSTTCLSCYLPLPHATTHCHLPPACPLLPT